MFTIYSLTPAPWGDDYRPVETFNTREQAETVLAVLESCNVDFNVYKIIDWNANKGTEKLEDK